MELRTCPREWPRLPGVPIVDGSRPVGTIMHSALAGAAAAALMFALAGARESAPQPPRHPVPATPLRALPSLASSDAVVREAVLKLPGAHALVPMLQGEGLVRRFVARVDDVARGAGEDSRDTVAALAAVDTKAAATLYSRLYPLLQQAYEERSPRRGYFNDRVVEAIDRLLEDDGAQAAAAREKLRAMRRLIALRGPGG